MNQPVSPEMKSQALGGLVLVMLEVHQWSGSKRLTKEALIAKNPEFKNLPPQTLATLGGTKICDPAELAGNLARKREAEKLLSTNGLPFMKGWGIPEDKWNYVYGELERIKKEFDSLTQSLYFRFDKAINDWRTDPKHVDWAHLVNDVPSAQYVAGRMSFTYHPVRVMAPSAEEGHTSNASYKKQMTGLKGELFADAAAEAEHLIANYLTGQDKDSGVVRRREKITQKTIRPLRRICEKLKSFSFLDPTVEPLSSLIEHVLSMLPQEGPIDGIGLTHVWQLAQTLGNPASAMQIARVVMDMNSPAAAFEQLLDTPKMPLEAPATLDHMVLPVAEPLAGPSLGSDKQLIATANTVNTQQTKASYVGLF